MHSVPHGSFERLTRPEALWRAWRACRLGKGRHSTVAAFDLDADREVFRLHRELRGGTYRSSAWRLRLIHDSKTGEVLPTRAPAVFLGYHVNRAGIGPSRKLRRRLNRRLHHAAA